MKVCIPIRADSEKEIFNVIKKAIQKNPDFIEIWLDKLKNPDIKKIIKTTKIPLIFVNRTNAPEMKRTALLLDAIKYGAAYTDLDIKKTPISTIKKIIAKSITGSERKRKTKIILSYHDFQKTPPFAELEKIIKKMFDLGANIAKIATFIKKDEDNEILLSLIKKMKKSGEKVIIHGMGEKGKKGRMETAMLGSEISYVTLDKKHTTAEGQWTIDGWRRNWKFYQSKEL